MDENNKKRPIRNLTSLTLKWLADRVRRIDKIRADVEEGAYEVPSEKVAGAIVPGESKEEEVVQ